MESSICLILLCMAASLDGSYRYDYTYFPEANGWLKLHTIPSSWYDARLRCRFEGGSLASPLDAGLQQAMETLIIQNTRPHYMVYTGIHSTFSKGDFFSIEGVPLSKIPIRWADNEPNNFFDQVSCLVMLEDGTVANVYCNDTHPSICYRKLPQNPVIDKCGTVDDTYELNPQTGKCYKFHRIPQTWSRAVMVCAAEGGNLIVIDNEVEANIAKEMFARNPVPTILGNFYKDSAFVGIYGWGRNGDWVAIDGRRLKEIYHKFAIGEPNNSGKDQFCGAILRNGLLDDIWCYGQYVFICEKSPDSLL